MLTLLIGRSGSGKTKWVLNTLKKLTAEEKQDKLLLLVPEQNSFENERALLEILSPAEAAKTQVLSFTHLAHTVFREIGGLAEELLDDGTRALLMSRALELTARMAEDHEETLLGISPRQATDISLVQELLALHDEIKQCAVSIDELERVETELDGILTAAEETLCEKTRGLYRIFSMYEGLAKNCGVDSADLLTRLADRLPDSRLAAGATILVDGFKGFSVQELRVLEGLMTQAADMTITLGTDTPGKAWLHACPSDNGREYALFSPVTDTVERLQEIAARHGQSFRITLLEENHRPDNEALRVLEAGLYHPAPTVLTAKTDAVTVTPCEDIYEECAYVARCIRKLMREGVRCRDITVVTRHLADYQSILDDALEEARIPYYMDARQELLCEPLIVYIRAALRIAVRGFSTEDLLRLLKTDLAPLTPLETAKLENYLYMWRIDGAALTAPFTENPGGMDAKNTADNAQALAQLESWRQQITAPLIALRQKLRGAITGRQFALAVYTFLVGDGQIRERTVDYVHRLEALGEPLLAERQARLWDQVIGLLDRFALALGEQTMSAARMEELFAMLAQTIDMGHIPQGLDAVTVGSADRICYAEPQVVFIVGANEGIFPAYPQNAGILTEEERRLWETHGIRLYGDLLRRCIEERYYVYMAIAAPKSRLFITHLTGDNATPSPLVEAVQKILPAHKKQPAVAEDGFDLETAEETFQRLALHYTHSTPVTEAFRTITRENPLYVGRLQAVARAAGQEPFRLQQPKVAAALFGTDMCLSASQTETFYDCHFAYFCRYGLRIKPRAVAQVDAAVFGTVVHHVMESLLPCYTKDGGLITELKAIDADRKGDSEEQIQVAETALQQTLMEQLRREIHQTVMNYVETTMGGSSKRSGSFLYRLQMAERAACNMLWHTIMELRQSAFTPVDYELRILPEEGTEDGVLSLRLPFDGGQVRLVGMVDRVDLYIREDGTAYARVVDYKTGSKAFDLSELTQGLSTQMLLYLFIVCDNSRRYLEQSGQLRPAGVLYHPLSDLVIGRNTANSHAARLRSMRMNGLVLDDPDVVLAMEKQGEKLFIPASLDKEGQVKGDAITARHFNLLRGVVEKLLTAMATALLAGDIAALPLCNDNHDPCKYCDYRAVCCRESEDPARVLRSASLKQVLEELEQEEVPCDG